MVLKANAPRFNILAVSDTYLNLVHKERQEILDKELFEAFPGSEGDPSEKSSVLNALLEVIDTKATIFQPIFKYEIFVAETGQHETHYWHNHHEPVLDSNGQTAYIINTTTNITKRIQLEQAVTESRKREQALITDLTKANQDLKDITNRLLNNEEILQLAISSANLGIWYLDVKTHAFVPSPRLKEMFGFYPDEEMPFEAAVAQITDEYREPVLKAIEAAINKGKPYNIQYIIIGYRDQKLRWVRATGKLYQENGAGSNGYFAGTMVDITEQKEDEQRKNDFISMVSHELKTPLSSIKGYTQILESRAKKSQDKFTLGLMEKTGKQVARMTKLIDGFLNVSRLESAKIHIECKRFDLANLIKETEEETITQISSHNVVFEPVETTFVNADRDKIGQILTNLISNAVKYSPQGTTVSIACVTRNNQALVSIKDEGRGIQQADLPKLFERFYRVENNEYRHVAGFGIGLYLCCEIIKRHDGNIWAESGAGKGSTFYFTLPLADA